MNSENNTNLFIKIYRSILSSSGTLYIEQIESPYMDMNPFLHKKARSSKIDNGAFVYSLLRLPSNIHSIEKIIIGQTISTFKDFGLDITEWSEVNAPARRRRMFRNDGQLAVFINSVTDVDDFICLLTAFQIEWNKIHENMKNLDIEYVKELLEKENYNELDNKINAKDFSKKLHDIYNSQTLSLLEQIKEGKVNFEVHQTKGSYIDYEKAVNQWFDSIVKSTEYKNLKDRPIYFVSSNTHSIVNNITGFVNEKEQELIQYLRDIKKEKLLDYWEHLEQEDHPGFKENFLWYVRKKYESDNPDSKKDRIKREKELGIETIESLDNIDIDVQVISLGKLVNSHLPTNLQADMNKLDGSDAMIINIDYPLGFGAYMVLSSLFKNLTNLKGVYILGKASFLNGKLGDIGLPVKIHDDHSKNTYLFDNCFDKTYFSEMKDNSFFSNQHAVSTKGTLLHPEDVLKQYFLDGYTILEMENGPYLNAIYETVNYKRYPENEIIDLINIPIDIGIIHYASDTPFTKAVTLGTRNLGYDGVDATYDSSLAILKRIVEVESKRI